MRLLGDDIIHGLVDVERISLEPGGPDKCVANALEFLGTLPG